MSNKEHFLAYLRHYSQRDLAQVSGMFADDVTLRDWNISVVGKAAAVAETQRNFESARSIEIQASGVYEAGDTVAGELRIVVDGNTELYVVDVISFDPDGKIKSIRAYLGRGDDQGMQDQ
jgi:ketosteroid isomerase-like protein